MAAEAAALCACNNLRRASRAVTRLYDEAFRPIELRATQVTLLMALQRLGEVTLSELADETVSERTSVSRNLKPLEARGLVKVGPGDDGRVRLARLTPKGREALGDAIDLWDAVQGNLTEELGVRRLERMLSDLKATVATARVD